MLTALKSMYLSLFSLTTIRPISVSAPWTIDFGTSCTGKDGRVRSGKILVSATYFKIFPSVRQKTFENFMVDGRKIEGSVSKTIQKDATNQIRTALIKENIVVINTLKEDTVSRVTDLTRQYKKNVLHIKQTIKP